ncbi:exosortase family protein XrtF [Chryseolinea sp. H1M3-3]|uniref:exosortase family protein XrtF n=1 Tax=Chryseolinea sp. H1M3-3 TaxID=3034144 RepID=UPI0023ED691F|nr:exosortase family protein XrtF [Chryseolinea sp. H1M3-3]
MKDFSINEFKPTILFLVKFVGIYLVGNFLYGLYVTAYEPRPDPMTHWVTNQTAIALSSCGWDCSIKDSVKSTTQLVHENNSVLAVYEGCNGINVMIIFVAFLIAFGPLTKPLIWFIPVGLVIMHLMNIARIGLLFFVSVYRKSYMYFMHKYFFTAILYVVVFMLWVWWVRKFASKNIKALNA